MSMVSGRCEMGSGCFSHDQCSGYGSGGTGCRGSGNSGGP